MRTRIFGSIALILTLFVLSMWIGFASTTNPRHGSPGLIGVANEKGEIVSVRPNQSLVNRLQRRMAERGGNPYPAAPQAQLEPQNFFLLSATDRRSYTRSAGDSPYWKHLFGNHPLGEKTLVPKNSFTRLKAEFLDDIIDDSLPRTYRFQLCELLILIHENSSYFGIKERYLQEPEWLMVNGCIYNMHRDHDANQAIYILSKAIRDMSPLASPDEVMTKLRDARWDPYLEDVKYVIKNRAVRDAL